MDIVEYNGASVRLIKVNQQMSSWQLLVLLWLLSSWSDANDLSENVTYCRGEDARITWGHKLPPFILIEWYFNDTLIAETNNESLSQDTLIINKNYEKRFRLIRTDNVGFNIKSVTENDSGEYTCIVTLQDTGDRYEWKRSFKVTDCATLTRSSTSGDETTTPTPTPAHNINALAIVLGVLIPLIPCGVVLVVCGVRIYRRQKRRSKNDGPEGESMNTDTT